jgi:hypothetical protein
LHVACQAGIMSIVTLLLKAGGDSNILDNDMKSCLDYLSGEKNEEIKTINSSNKRQKVDSAQVLTHLLICLLTRLLTRLLPGK